MAAADERDLAEDATGHSAADDPDPEDVSKQEQPEHRQPPSRDEAEQDNYANTDDGGS